VGRTTLGKSAQRSLGSLRCFFSYTCTKQGAVDLQNSEEETNKENSQLTPDTLSNAYFSVLLSRHSCRKVNNIRVPGVAHNPKVVSSNPTPATKESTTYRRRFPKLVPVIPQSEMAPPDSPSSLKDCGV
jgi:hypothetical protein